MSAVQYGKSVVIAGSFFALIGILFFDSLLVSCFLFLLGFANPRWELAKRRRRAQQELTMQFKQALSSFSSLLSAGKSVENAIPIIITDLKLVYPNPRTSILREFAIIQYKLNNGISIEQAIADFGKRSGCDDIMQFSEVFETCKRTGGDLIEVIRRTANMMSEKLEIKQELQVMIAQKQFESKLINLIPYVLLAFLKFSSPDYLVPLYNGSGRLIMAICLAMLAICYGLTKRIVDLKV